ncbi:glycosyltransferase family 4 protein [uncultured Chryseobacterium sp.]|uniref:glycosyltransferase family 4 protein n=1 Tax=uncultured Chryseobacterium sp. TaxID=259322 RepID=UPI0025E4CA0C|nr:glycosyltransferase family 4 protein [uncultured Chryseobacterium sp.]
MYNNVLFLLPDSGKKPVGGFKVVYEYANRLQDDGFEVRIVYINSVFWCEKSLYEKIFSLLRFIFRVITQNYKPKWFRLKKTISQNLFFDFPNIKGINEKTKVVATSWHTAEYLADLDIPNENKFYLIQHYENWEDNEDRLIKTWKAPITKFVIAPWLKQIGDGLGVKTILLPNGFNFNEFYLKNPIENRKAYTVAMLYHVQKWKGFQDGFEALKKVRDVIKDLEVNIFGVYPRPIDFPNWANYYQLPSKEVLNDIYNNSAIFLGPSHSEGWGLTIGEAMIGGCAIVCTNNQGYRSMIIDRSNGLVVNIADINEMKEAVLKLILDNNLRLELANNGKNYISQFTWNKSYLIMKNEFMK